VTSTSGACANCGATLAGEYCSHCGQYSVNLQRPAADLLSDAVGDLLKLDTRQVAKDYIAGRAFFVFLPLFALFLELLYRKQGYLVDHLIFSLYYHAFVFVMFPCSS